MWKSKYVQAKRLAFYFPFQFILFPFSTLYLVFNWYGKNCEFESILIIIIQQHSVQKPEEARRSSNLFSDFPKMRPDSRGGVKVRSYVRNMEQISDPATEQASRKLHGNNTAHMDIHTRRH